jgi:hypothetical protein
MQLIINKTTNTVDFGFDTAVSFTKGDNWIEVNGSKWINLDPNDYEELNVDGNLPTNFFPKCFSYIQQTGEFYQTTECELAWEALRKERNKRLTECDWTQVPDVNLTNKADWDTYRQVLRDLPSTTINPWGPNWPKDPNWIDLY